MALKRYVATAIDVALTAGTTRTVLQISGKQTTDVLALLRWGVFFNGVESGDEPISVWLETQDWNGTHVYAQVQEVSAFGISSSASNCFASYTAEPAHGYFMDVARVHPQSGYEVILPFDAPIIIKNSYVGIRCTAHDNDVTVTAKMYFEE